LEIVDGTNNEYILRNVDCNNNTNYSGDNLEKIEHVNSGDEVEAIDGHTPGSDDTVCCYLNSDKLCTGTFVILEFNGKPYVGIVREIGLSNVLVECMRRNGKQNQFCFPKKIKDINWYKDSDVIAMVDCSLCQNNKYKLDEKSYLIYTSQNI